MAETSVPVSVKPPTESTHSAEQRRQEDLVLSPEKDKLLRLAIEQLDSVSEEAELLKRADSGFVEECDNGWQILGSRLRNADPGEVGYQPIMDSVQEVGSFLRTKISAIETNSDQLLPAEDDQRSEIERLLKIAATAEDSVQASEAAMGAYDLYKALVLKIEDNHGGQLNLAREISSVTGDLALNASVIKGRVEESVWDDDLITQYARGTRSYEEVVTEAYSRLNHADRQFLENTGQSEKIFRRILEEIVNPQQADTTDQSTSDNNITPS